MLCCRWLPLGFLLLVLVVGFSWEMNDEGRRSLRQVANDCNSPSCCGYTEGSVGCRFQGNRCRCPFLIPGSLAIRSPYSYRVYSYVKRRRPAKHEDHDRR